MDSAGEAINNIVITNSSTAPQPPLPNPLPAGARLTLHERLEATPAGLFKVCNWHLFNPEAEDVRVGGVMVGQLGPETPEAFARTRLGELWECEFQGMTAIGCYACQVIPPAVSTPGARAPRLRFWRPLFLAYVL